MPLGQPIPRPDDDIVSQTSQQYHHLLGEKLLFVPLGEAKTLMVLLDRGLYPSSW